MLLTLALAPLAMAKNPYNERGLLGYGITTAYYPLCALTCRDLTPYANITCADNSNADGGYPSPECFAGSLEYLQALAYCMSGHCADVDPLDLGNWWTYFAVYSAVGPRPNLSYAETLASIPPNSTLVVDEDLYTGTFNSYTSYWFNECSNSWWSLIVTTSCALLPVVLSLLRLLPIPIRTVSKIRSLLIDAPLVQRKVHLPLLGRFSTPSRGQALLIGYIVSINVIASSVQISSIEPQAWYTTNLIALVRYVANRTGVISIANVPLLILFAGRNNFLMWLTNWSHSTFLLLHRAVAIMCTLEACTHSLLYLCLYVDVWGLAEDMKEPYWICGVLATLGMCLMLPLAVRRLRNLAYEAFLITHILGAVLTVVALWYHIVLIYENNYGYELWIEVAIAVWGFDRLFRVLRFVRNGARYAVAYRIDDNYLRIDIPDVYAAGHVFLYFPTLTWRVWENHPFSVAAFDTRVPVLQEKDDESDTSTPIERNKGISLLIRNHDGTTRKIGGRAVPLGDTPVPFRVLVESSYGAKPIPPRTLRDYPNVVCIAGGVGITALLPLIESRPVKLYWETRSQALVDATRDLLESNIWTSAKVFVSERMHLEEVINTEVEAGPTLVLVSGPSKMMAETRRLVALAGQKGAVVHYMEESFNW